MAQTTASLPSTQAAWRVEHTCGIATSDLSHATAPHSLLAPCRPVGSPRGVMMSMDRSGPSHSWLAYWLDAELPSGDDKALRAVLAAQGVSARGARLYLDYGDRLFAPLGSAWIQRHDSARSRSSAIAWLKLLQACEMDIAPPTAFVRAIAQCCRPKAGLGSVPVMLFRAAWRGWSQASYGGQSAADFVRDELKPLFLWALHRHETHGLDPNQTRRGWAWLRKVWQDDCRLRALPPPVREWPAACPDAIFKGVRLIPLTSKAALEDEGEVMAHCIADYFFDSTLGKGAQVYSARDPKTLERKATVALVLGDDGRWEIDDVKAKSNHDAAPAVHAAAQALVATINIRATRKLGVKT